MEKFEYDSLSEVQKTAIKHFFFLKEKFKVFENNSTELTFKEVFGEKEGERLWESFVTRCDRNSLKFLTFLSEEQKTVFIVNLIKYSNLAKLIL